jgi:phosphoribosylformylglycinamidine synthase
MWQIANSIKGLGEAARAFDIPVVSGNVSLYNQTHGQGIQPTPLLALVGLLEDVSCAVPSTFQNDGDVVLLIGETNPAELGGSAYLAEAHAIERGQLPALDYALERRTCDCIRELAQQKLLRSCHDLSQGGLGVALAESCFNDYSAPRGVSLQLKAQPSRRDGALFAETGARFLMSCSQASAAAVRAAIEGKGLSIAGEGVVGGSNITIDGVATISANEAFAAWFHGLDEIFRD